MRGLSLPGPAGFPQHFIGGQHLRGPILVLRQPFLFGTRSFWSEEAYNLAWSPTCGRVLPGNWLGAPGYDLSCNPIAGAAPLENYVVRSREELAPYVFGLEGSELIWLYLKDGTVLGVTDYWFINGEMHFRMDTEAAEGLGPRAPRRREPSEHVLTADQLDVPRTIEVNTARGFRVIARDEPLERYLRDHPNDTPPPLAAPNRP